jgi:hypothetical protein
LCRWISILLYATLGVWFGGFAGLLYYRLWQLIFRMWPHSLGEYQYSFLAGTSAILLVGLLKISGMRPCHARHFWRYPPLWTSLAIIGTALAPCLFVYERQLPFNGAAKWLVLAFAFSGWLVMGLALPACYRRRSSSTNEEPGDHGHPKSLDAVTHAELETWLADERAIESSEQDFFGAADRALRIWNVLQTRRSAVEPNLMQTVVLEGPLGSGKTSVINLLNNIIASRGDGKFLLMRVSAWGFSSSAAREYILRQVVENLSNEVDCLAVRDLPRDYVDALTESSKWFALLKPSLSEPPPAQRLKRLLPILAAIDLRLVVVIEDSDRNDVDFNPQHLQSMLNDFRAMERMTFILTVGSTSRVDFPKIAEQIESIPRLSRDQALFMVDQLRDYCRSTWPIIDPIANEPE